MIDPRNLLNVAHYEGLYKKKVPPGAGRKKIRLYYLLVAACSSTILSIQIKQQ